MLIVSSELTKGQTDINTTGDIVSGHTIPVALNFGAIEIELKMQNFTIYGLFYFVSLQSFDDLGHPWLSIMLAI